MQRSFRGVSDKAPDAKQEGPTVAELAIEIQTQRAGHTVESAPARANRKRPEQVTRHRAEVIEMPREELPAPSPAPEEEPAPMTLRQQVRSKPVWRSLY